MGQTEREELDNKIYDFMGRKAQQHPDLNLLEKWGDYERTPINRQ